ncbi:hypothetical protein DJ031_06755 [bacterium endosymbiont of Escarpia laminata]|nr:MAG: hypothetical protein DJ031_06755 [bacterium endosymbiont of Escarpia laminata]
MRQDLFTHVVNNLRYGAAQADLSEALNDCVNRSRETGKQSTLTLTIKIKPNGSTGQYHLSEEVKTKLPNLDKGETIMFGTPEGNLQREDPAQSDLDLQAVPDDRPTDFQKVENN